MILSLGAERPYVLMLTTQPRLPIKPISIILSDCQYIPHEFVYELQKVRNATSDKPRNIFHKNFIILSGFLDVPVWGNDNQNLSLPFPFLCFLHLDRFQLVSRPLHVPSSALPRYRKPFCKDGTDLCTPLKQQCTPREPQHPLMNI